jgi:hypothetical protein
MNTEEIKQIWDQYYYYILVLDILIGFVLGAIPLILGIRRNKRTIGMVAFVVSGLIGGLSPIFSLIAAAIFTFVILRKPASPILNSSDQDLV